jgi:hypothetical protein
MNLDEQIRALVEGAPDIESSMSVAAIAPVLQQIAEALPHQSYYICASPTGDWAITTLRHRQNPNSEIRVLYAFGSVSGIEKFYDRQPDAEIAVEIPVIHLLFETLSFPVLDQVIFYHHGTNFDRGQELSISDLEQAITQHLKQLQTPARSSNLPPDIC